MDRDVNNNFKFNQETEFVPILGLVTSQLNAPGSTEDKQTETPAPATSVRDNHHSALLSLLAGEMSVAPDEIHDFELYVPIHGSEVLLILFPSATCTTLRHQLSEA